MPPGRGVTPRGSARCDASSTRAIAVRTSSASPAARGDREQRCVRGPRIEPERCDPARRSRARRAGRARGPRAGRRRGGARLPRRRGGARARRRARSGRGGARAGRTRRAPRAASRPGATRSRRPRRPRDRARARTVSSRAPWRSPTTRPASSTSASEQPTCSPTIASSAGAPRPSRTACASRSCTSSARSSRGELLVRELRRDRLRQRDEGHLVGDGDEREAQLARPRRRAPQAARPSRSRRRRRGPARPCSARRRTYSRCGRESSPTPSPVVIRSSPPSSHGVGSGSSETWTQRIGLSRPSAPAASSSPRPGRSAISRTVSMASAAPLGRPGQDATPCSRPKASIQAVFACCTSASLRHFVEGRHGMVARPVHCAGGRGGRESRACLSGSARRSTTSSRRGERYVARGRLDSAARGRRAPRARGSRRPTAPSTSTSPAGSRCQNTGHGFAPVVAAIHEQVDRFLHQCFMVGTYEPYVEVCRRLAEHSPCAGERAEVDPRQLGRRGDRERGQDRACRDRPPRRRRLRQRLPRPHAADDGDDEQGAPVQGRLRAVPVRGLPRRRAVSVPRHRLRRRDRGARAPVQERGRRRSPSRASCSRPCRARAASSRCRADFLRAARARSASAHGILYVADEVQSGVGRTGPMWAIEHYDGVEPDLARLRASRSAAGCRSRRSPARAEIMDAPGPGGLGGTFGGNPVACAAAARRARHGRGARVPRPRGRARRDAARRVSTSLRRATSRSARCAGSGRCWRSSSRAEPGPRREDHRRAPSSAACSCSPAASTAT